MLFRSGLSPPRIQYSYVGDNLLPVVSTFTTLLRVRSIMARFTQCSAVAHHILQFGILVPVLYMVCSCGLYRQPVLVRSAVPLAFFAQIPSPTQYHFAPAFMFCAVIIRIIWHYVFAPFGYHTSAKPPPASYWRSPAGQEGGIGPDQAHPENSIDGISSLRPRRR